MRGVVDGAVRGRSGRRLRRARRPQHVDTRCSRARKASPWTRRDAADAEAVGGLAQLSDPGALAGHAGLDDATDAVAWHEARQPAGMVLVWVRQHDEVDAPVPDGDALVEPPHEQVRIGPAVHEQACAVRRLDAGWRRPVPRRGPRPAAAPPGRTPGPGRIDTTRARPTPPAASLRVRRPGAVPRDAPSADEASSESAWAGSRPRPAQRCQQGEQSQPGADGRQWRGQLEAGEGHVGQQAGAAHHGRQWQPRQPG